MSGALNRPHKAWNLQHLIQLRQCRCSTHPCLVLGSEQVRYTYPGAAYAVHTLQGCQCRRSCSLTAADGGVHGAASDNCAARGHARKQPEDDRADNNARCRALAESPLACPPLCDCTHHAKCIAVLYSHFGALRTCLLPCPSNHLMPPPCTVHKPCHYRMEICGAPHRMCQLIQDLRIPWSCLQALMVAVSADFAHNAEKLVPAQVPCHMRRGEESTTLGEAAVRC